MKDEKDKKRDDFQWGRPVRINVGWTGSHGRFKMPGPVF